MAIKIQLRRDLSTNWTQNNPLLLNGEIGIETDTLKLKIGNGTDRWNAITAYAFKPGLANGIATLNSDGKIPLGQLPDQVSLDTEALLAIQNALSEISTSDIPEGDNLYFTDVRALAVVQDAIDDAVTTAAADATSKANTAKSQAISAAATDATTKANAAKDDAKTYAENFVQTTLDVLSTSDIEEGSNLYYTQSRVDNRIDSVTGPLFTNMTSYVDNTISSALDNFTPSNSINTTNDLPEGSSNLYFTATRARSALANTVSTPTLIAALSSVDDLRTEVANEYIKISEKDSNDGVAGLSSTGKISINTLPSIVATLDSGGKLSSSVLPSGIATNSYVDSAINSLIGTAPGTLDTLQEIAAVLQSAESVAGLTELITLKAPIESPTFTGTVTIPAGSDIVGYATLASPIFTGTVTIPAGADISGYATSLQLASGVQEAKDYTDTAFNSLGSSLGDPETILRFADIGVMNGVAGLDSNVKIQESVLPLITNGLLEYSSITLNGTPVSLGGSLNVGYSNGVSSSNTNKITYGTSATPPSSGNNAGDIYIQY
jgi:hypothetical protein